MNKSDQLNELFDALSKAQGEMKSIPKTGKNPHFGSKFATLDSTLEMIRAPLAKYGLAITHSLATVSDKYILETLLTHKSGQWMGCELELILDRKNMQGMGSATTYAKRYAVQAILGICGDEDDDGNATLPVSVDKIKKESKSRPKNFAPSTNVNTADDFVILMGSPSVKNKKIKELNESTLKEIYKWVTDEIKRKPTPTGIEYLLDCERNIKNFLKEVGVTV